MADRAGMSQRQHWSNIKAIIKARRQAGEQITVAQWSEANAPVTHRWLDEFSGFADRWEEFRAAWKWAQTLPYLPERRPGLHGFVDLINTKAKLEHVRGERALHRSEKNGPVNAGIEILQGDCLAVLRTLPSRSIQTCVTSPPYFQLRDYLTATWIGGDAQCDHRKLTKERVAKSLATSHGRGTRRGTHQHEVHRASCSKCGATSVDNQIGQEEKPEQYVARLVEVLREVRRVLRDDGTLWLNLGDTHNNRARIRKCPAISRRSTPSPRLPEGHGGQRLPHIDHERWYQGKRPSSDSCSGCNGTACGWLVSP